MRSSWRLALVLVFGVLSAAGPADAKPMENASRIGWLSDGVRSAARSDLPDVFLDALTDLGYVEGQTVILERRDAVRNMKSLDVLAAELVGDNVDVIVATSSAAARAARRATSSIPVVIAESGDPAATGVVASTLAHPGGNVTALSVMDPNLTVKRLQLLKEIAPRISRVAVLYHPPLPVTLMAVNEVRSAAARLGLTVVPVEVSSPDALSLAFATARRLRADSLIAFDDPFTSQNRRRIVELAMKHRLPATYLLPEYAEDGGLMAYGPNFWAIYRQAAVLVDKILKGARPEDLPVESPARLELTINLTTAKTLGLRVPPSVGGHVDHVILE
jgi:putative ABC transport system substrate-binding protein